MTPGGLDARAMRAISPAALVAYVRTEGWRPVERYGETSDVYENGSRPELVVPRTTRIADYERVVARLIEFLADEGDREPLAVYRALTTADRDAVGLRVEEADDGSLPLRSGRDLVSGAWDLLLAVACSLKQPQAVYRLGANVEAAGIMDGFRLGQTEQGSYAITLLTPALPPPLFRDAADRGAPAARRLTLRLEEALKAARGATERATVGESSDLADSVRIGLSSNLCDALARLVAPFATLDLDITWAQTRPVDLQPPRFRFARSDAPVLREAATALRDRAPRPDERLHGFVSRLSRSESEETGAIGLRATVDGQHRSVQVVLARSDYERAVDAHKARAMVEIHGDLERLGQRWRLLNPRITDVVRSVEPDEARPSA